VNIAQSNDELPGAEAWGVGSAYRSRAEGIASLNWNPAGIGYISFLDMQIHFNQDAIGMAVNLPYELGGAGFMVQGLDEPESLDIKERLDIIGLKSVRDTELTIGYGRRFQNLLSFGVAGIYREFESSQTEHFGYHLGFLVSPRPNIRIGLDILDQAINSDNKEIDLDYFKKNLHASFSWQTSKTFNFSLDSNTEISTIGFEFSPSILRLRMGAIFDISSGDIEPKWTAGVGINYRFIDLNYAYRHFDNEQKHIVSLGFRFDRRKPRILEYLPIKLQIPDTFSTDTKIQTPVEPDIPEIPKPLLTAPDISPSYDIDLFIVKTERFPVNSYIIKVEILYQGMTISDITKKYGDKIPEPYRNPYQLAQYNGISDVRRIPAGTQIKVPLSARAVKEPGGFEDAFVKLKKAYEQKKNDLATINNLAVLYIERNEIEDARILLETLVDSNPKVSPPYVNLGLLYMIRDDFVSAKKLLEKAVQINPDSANAYCNLGLAYLSTDDITHALDLLYKAVEIDTRHADARYNLAIALDKDYQHEEALTQLKELVRLWPEDKDALREIERLQGE